MSKCFACSFSSTFGRIRCCLFCCCCCCANFFSFFPLICVCISICERIVRISAALWISYIYFLLMCAVYSFYEDFSIVLLGKCCHTSPKQDLLLIHSVQFFCVSYVSFCIYLMILLHFRPYADRLNCIPTSRWSEETIPNITITIKSIFSLALYSFENDGINVITRRNIYIGWISNLRMNRILFN